MATVPPTDVALLIARVGIAALMCTHSIPKLIQLFSDEPVKFPPVMGMNSELSLPLTMFAEFICSLFVFVGLGTRLAAIFSGITMLVAALYIHAADAFPVKEMSLHFLLVYVVLLIAGSGRYSIDYLLQQKRAKNQRGTGAKTTVLAA
jgi:putative oxidoreductase